jgi:hypothetical protein
VCSSDLSDSSAIAAIADESERRAAMRQMHEDMRFAKQNHPEVPQAITDAVEAVRTACGDTFKFRMGHGKMGMGLPMMKMKHRGVFFERPLDPTQIDQTNNQ